MYCRSCGKEMNENQAVCLNCGVPAGKGKAYCPDCGNQVSELAVMCVVCGKNLEENVAEQSQAQATKPAAKKFNKKLLIPIIVAGVIFIGILIALISGAFDSGSSGGSYVSSKDFNDMFYDIKSESWCDIAYDGTWMKLDTNPNNIEDSFNSSAWYKIKSVLTQLGFPSSVAEEMNATRALDGRLSATHGRYEVTWTYHPDKGLEVLFKIVN